MTRWFKVLSAFGSVDALDERWEQEDHVAAFIHDRCTAVSAGYFAREVMLDRLGCGIVPAKIMDAVDEVDVGLVEDGCMLERSLK